MSFKPKHLLDNKNRLTCYYQEEYNNIYDIINLNFIHKQQYVSDVQ